MQENRITLISTLSPDKSLMVNEKGDDVTTNVNASALNANDIDQAQFEADKRAVYK